MTKEERLKAMRANIEKRWQEYKIYYGIKTVVHGRDAHDVVNKCWNLYRAYVGTTNDENDKWLEIIAEAKRIKDEHPLVENIDHFVVWTMEQLENDAKEIDND